MIASMAAPCIALRGVRTNRKVTLIPSIYPNLKLLYIKHASHLPCPSIWWGHSPRIMPYTLNPRTRRLPPPASFVAPKPLAMEGAPPEAPHQAGQLSAASALALVLSTPKTLVELAVDGQKQLDTVVEAAHDILLTLNRALCSPNFWVAPSLQAGNAANSAGTAAVTSVAVTGAGGVGEAGETGTEEKGSESSAEGLAALDATRVRYKAATGALRATVAAIVKQTQAVRAEGDGAAAENVDTETDYLERRAADLREEVERKNMIVKLHMDQLRTLLADIFMWQTTGL